CPIPWRHPSPSAVHCSLGKGRVEPGFLFSDLPLKCTEMRRCAHRFPHDGGLLLLGAPLTPNRYEGLCSRLMRLRRKTLLKRNWQAAELCSSSVELTFMSVTAVSALMVASRFAPRT